MEKREQGVGWAKSLSAGDVGKGPERAEGGGRGRYVLYFNVYKIVRFTNE